MQIAECPRAQKVTYNHFSKKLAADHQCCYYTMPNNFSLHPILNCARNYEHAQVLSEMKWP